MLNLKHLFGKSETKEAAVQLAPGQHAPGIAGAVAKLFDKNEKEVAKLRPTVERVNALTPELKALSDDELKARSLKLRETFKARVTEILKADREHDFDWLELDTQLDWSDEYDRARKDAEKRVLDELLPEAFALTREAGDRTIGLRHFDVQLIGGAVLHSGRIGEMRTGEGKTLVATLPAYLNALSGRGVHVITVNDYLAERDANWMRPIYEFLGLKVAFLTNDMDNDARKPAYASDVLYATNSEVGFDYLRDNMARTGDDVVQRPLNFAIVDEVDNILIDEARTPLIISAQVAKTDRALRRQQMAKTCDGLARIMMPAVTDREIENLQDDLTERGRIDIGALLHYIIERGAFTQATSYLISSYLLSEKSARVENAGHLLDVADEYSNSHLINEEGRAQLERVAVEAVHPERLREAWTAEITRLTKPLASAWTNAIANNFDARVLAHDLDLDIDTSTELVARLDESGDKRATAAQIVSDEAIRRGLVGEDASDFVVQATSQNEIHNALMEAILAAPGGVQEADALLAEAASADDVQTVQGARRVIGALEQISLHNLLPFETTEKLWEAVRLNQGADKLRNLIAQTVEKNSADNAQKVAKLANEYSLSRAAFLEGEAQTLRAALGGHEVIIKLAQSGASESELRQSLQSQLAKSGAFADAIKLAKKFNVDQQKVHQQVAISLVEEMAQWVEVPQNAPQALVEMMNEGGKIAEVRDRILLAVRDLPGENTELPALVGESLRQLQEWRTEHAQTVTAQINEKVALPDESRAALITAIEDAEYSNGLEPFVGQTLLTAPQVSGQVEAVEAFAARFTTYKAQADQQFIDDINVHLNLSSDATEAVGDLLDDAASSTRLTSALFETIAGDAVSRHLEPLLTEGNAVAFAEEVTRRIPLAKDVQKRVKAANFAGRSANQLSRALVRLLEQSFQSLPVEDFKRVVRNLGWLSEKDEKRRQAALSDMGTLVAEREAGGAQFDDPEGFLDTLVTSEILTPEEAAIVRRAQAEDNASASSVIDRVLRLPAERRRRLSEAKLQEIQGVLDQSVKAHALFHREVHYVIGSNPESGKTEILIVDEFTGRKMPGRRFSEGLHEALEAKHNLEVQLESQTVATITIQNYFRLYNKLGGMTGTAKTEEAEFAKTYGIEVISVPTNRQIKRRDAPDVIYKTQEAKARAISFDILEHHCVGQPVLVGTRSVEVSEQMSERLKAAPLQTLVLTHLIKTKLFDSKEVSNEQRAEIFRGLNAPIAQLNPLAIKNLAKQHGINADAAADENVDTLLSMFTMSNANRERLQNALKVGLPHNVLNAKNHRHEARMVAEAARLGAVTIATNMAGRGVDIVLGGTLDVESRWRVMTLQTLARHLEGKTVHVRSRNDETTQKFVERLQPNRLQELAWLTAVRQSVESLEKDGTIQGSAAKELRDTLLQDLTTPDLQNKVRSRARRLNLLEKLPLDDAPTTNRVLDSLNAEMSRLLQKSYNTDALRETLEHGVPAAAHGRDEGESALLEALSRPLSIAYSATGSLLQTLNDLPNLDAELLKAASGIADLGYEQSYVELSQKLEVVTSEWVEQRLRVLGIAKPEEAAPRMDTVPYSQIEVNELQIARALGESNLGTQWLRERLRGWNLVTDPRAYQALPEMQEELDDAAVVHLQLDKTRVSEMLTQWNAGGDAQRALVQVEAPNLILLGDVADVAGQDAPFISPEWLHYAMNGLGILTEQDVFEAQLMGQAEDEQGVLQEMPIDVLVYRIRLDRVLNALFPTLREAVTQVGSDADRVLDVVHGQMPWTTQFIDREWIAARLEELGASGEEVQVANEVSVSIETGVAGQSADIVLEGEARAEDIAHTSDGDEVKLLQGLHIIGTERHESRRIDNQLRGRAGRQGDPGSSRFYVSLEDELWRLFGVRGQALLNKWDEEEAVEHSWISKSVERAQKKVELNHFEGRKHVLQFDDVMNVQREVIYRERRRALMGGNLRDTVLDMAQQAALGEAEKHCPRAVRVEEWDTHKLYLGLSRLYGASILHKHLNEDELTKMRSRDEMDDHLKEVASACYDERETQIGDENLRGLERWQVTRTIDEYWMEQLAEMDYLRDAIWQEGYAQKEPIGVYRQEGFALFQKMLGEIRREVTEAIFSGQNDLPQGDFEYGGLEMGELQEARLMQMLPMDEDGLDDGEQLQKDADGDDETLVMAGAPVPPLKPTTSSTRSSSESSGGFTVGSSMADDSTSDENRPLSRAERRAQKRK